MKLSRLSLGMLVCLAACTRSPAKPDADTRLANAVCVDTDHDGFGPGCTQGADCSDRDPSIHEGCGHCALPAVDCACARGTAPLSCFLDKTEAADGTVMCNEGTRYCRDGVWSGCESIHSYPRPESSGTTALVDPDAAAVQCNDCNVRCFRISDNLEPVDGGLLGTSNQIGFLPGGGLTLATIPNDGGMGVDSGPPVVIPDCMLGSAPDIDCDGIPDVYDPYPNTPPFATANPSIFLDIAPGETGTGLVDLAFHLNLADIYFLVDQTGSMTEETDRLKADLITGDFINDPTVDCADYDFDQLPNNELKTQGIIGAIRCNIRDSNFGVGFFREIPFPTYAGNDHVAFGNEQDITNTVADVLTGVEQLENIGNYEWPEASMLALNSLATGDGMYFGLTKTSIPTRTTCPVGTWGYPCFRDGAIPIVVMFTDAMFHNGPDANAYTYDPNQLTIQSGTVAGDQSVDKTNEDFATAYDLGDLTTSLMTYTGNSDGMTADLDASLFTCLSTNGGPDALFKFTLAQQRQVLITTQGSRFDTVLGLFTGVPTTAATLSASNNLNETAATARDLGDLTLQTVTLTGNTAAMAADYDWSTINCSSAGVSPDAVYKFDLTEATGIHIDSNGSTMDTVVSLHSAAPPLKPTYTASANTNDKIETSQAMGTVDGTVRAYSGNTAAAGIDSDYTGAKIGCNADTAADDAVYDFTLTNPARVRISSEGSAFDTVLALVGETCLPDSGPSGGSSTGAGSTGTNPSTVPFRSNKVHTFDIGSYIIPMDTTYQDYGMFKAYGLAYQLLLNDIPVAWVIKKNKLRNEADFTTSAKDVKTLATITDHGYRGGPFVVDSVDAARALPIITAWQTAHTAVNVHRTTKVFTQQVKKAMVAAPTIAMFADGNQDIARGYMAAAGISDSTGNLGWPDTSPDMLTPVETAGPTSTNHHDGMLFDADGTPAYCQMMSMHWSLGDSVKTVGPEVVAEYRDFLQFPVHLFAECQAVSSIENSVNGHFLTPNGFTTGIIPSSWTFDHFDLPFAQMDGTNFVSTGGSEPSYSLPVGETYYDDNVVMVTDGATSVGVNDVWMTGYVDGSCSILEESCDPDRVQGLAQGKVSYLGGHRYVTNLPLSTQDSQGTRFFLNALFEADCSSDLGFAGASLDLVGPAFVTTSTVTYTMNYGNDGPGIMYNTVLEDTLDPLAVFVSATGGGTFSAGKVSWSLQSLAAKELGSVSVTVSLPQPGNYTNSALLTYKQGRTVHTVSSATLTTSYNVDPPLASCSDLGVTNLVSPSSNETQGVAFNLGTLNSRSLQVSGSTQTMTAEYSTTEIGCNANTAAPDAVFNFTLVDPANVQIDTAGTSWDTVVSLHDQPIGSIAYTTTANANENYDTSQDLGTMNGRDVVVNDGSTNFMMPDYNQAFTSCTSQDNSPDASFKFHLDNPTTMRVDLTGSSFNTVVSLYRPPPVTSTTALTAAYTNEAQASAYNTGTIDTATRRYTASTAGMADNFNITCNGSHPDSKDSVFKFHVNATSSYMISTDGSAYDTIIALYPATIVEAVPAPTPVVSTNLNKALTTATVIGAMDGKWLSYTGNTSAAGDDSDYAECGASNKTLDVFYKFSVADVAGRTITIDTQGSAFDTVIGLLKLSGASYVSPATTPPAANCDDNSAPVGTALSKLTAVLPKGDYALWIRGKKFSGDKGAYQVTFKDSAVAVSNMITCDDDSGFDKNDSTIVRTLTPGDYHVVVKGALLADNGAYSVTVRDKTWYDANTTRLACSNTPDYVETALGAGDYWFIIKGYLNNELGTYKLRVRDVTNAPTSPPAITCNDDTGGGTDSKIRLDLAAGSYSIVLKGNADGDSGIYSLQVSDTAAPTLGVVIACDDDSGEGVGSVIERDLGPGTYRVVVKGDAPTDEGAYKLSVRDVTNAGYARLTCDQDSGIGTASSLDSNLTAGTYYAVVKGDADAEKGAYALSIRDSRLPVDTLACDDDGANYRTSEINQTLNPGEYYVALKGFKSTEHGDYQLTVGAAAVVSSTYTPPTWNDTQAALDSRGMRVMSVLSCQDDTAHGDIQGDCKKTREQAVSLAKATDALGPALSPLVFDISKNGTGLSKTVVNAINDMAAYLEMDVKIRVVFDPDPNPGFLLTVTAIDQAGDQCDGLIGIEHQNCVPGATPRFTLAFENPLSAPVPTNPADPNGGYNFRAELIGDNQFIVDSIPIYIIPADVIPNPPPPPSEVYAMGTYWQDNASPGCGLGQAPDWHDLSWTANVYENTTIDFKVCTGDTAAELATCTPTLIASITGAGACTSDADCPLGFCDPDVGACQIITAGTCVSAASCPAAATCESGACVFNSQPVYIGGSIGVENNFHPYLRMYVSMSVVQPFVLPPALYGWEMTYICETSE